MTDILIVTKVLLKNTLTPLKGNSSRWKNAAYVLMAICMLPLAFMIYMTFANLFGNGFTGLGIQMGLFMMTLFGGLLCMFSFPTIFYFSEDTLQLLPLPLRPGAIVTAKLFVIYASVAAVDVLVLLPMLIAYILSGNASVLSVLLLIVIGFLCSLIPLFLLGIMTMIVMRFLPFFRNKDMFNMIFGVLAIALSVWISVQSSTMGAQDVGMDEMLVMLSQNVIPSLSGVFFWITPAAQAVADLNWISFLLLIIIFAAFALVFYLLANWLYLPAVTSAMGSSKKKGKASAIKVSTALRAWEKTELKVLFRTPAYLTNCVLSALIMPVIMIIILFFNPELKELTSLREVELPLGFLVPAAFAIGALIALFCGSMNSISATAISREGTSGVAFIKSTPDSLGTVLKAKLNVSLLFTVLASLMFLIIFHYFFTYPFWVDLIYLAGTLVTGLLSNWINLLADGMRPKLVWENETVAVKNNYNLLISMLFEWILLVILVLPGALLLKDASGFEQMQNRLIWYSLFLLVVGAAADFAMAHYAPRIIEKSLRAAS